MGWGDCGTDSKGRPIGYAHASRCDYPDCKAKIDRGLSYACGGMHGTSEGGCEGYFCGKHLYHVEDPFGWVGRQKGFAVLCENCKNEHNSRLVEDLTERFKELEEAQAVNPELTDAQLARIRETICSTVEEWRLSHRIEWHKTHGELESLIVAAIWAMHRSGTLEVKPINKQADGPEGEDDEN